MRRCLIDRGAGPGFTTTLPGCIVLAGLLTAASAGLYGQSAATGTIIGNVTDPQAAAIPAAVVSVHNEGTGVERSMPTNGAGLYMFTSLPVGTYRVRVSKE